MGGFSDGNFGSGRANLTVKKSLGGEIEQIWCWKGATLVGEIG